MDDKQGIPLSTEDIVMLVRGERPPHIEYEMYRKLRTDLQKQTKHYLKGKLVKIPQKSRYGK